MIIVIHETFHRLIAVLPGRLHARRRFVFEIQPRLNVTDYSAGSAFQLCTRNTLRFAVFPAIITYVFVYNRKRRFREIPKHHRKHPKSPVLYVLVYSNE